MKTELQGRTLVLRVKMYTYEEAIRQKPLPYPIWKAKNLYDYALPLLNKLEEEYKPMKIRLMGLRLTNISTRKKEAGGTNFFKPILVKKRKFGGEEEERWEEWPEEEFQKYDETGFQVQQAGEIEIERNEEEMYFDGLKSDDFLAIEAEGLEGGEQPAKEEVEEEEVYWPCPICELPQAPDDRMFNDHVDYCLSKQTIREAVRLGDGENEFESAANTPVPSRTEASASPEKAMINAIFKEYRQGGNQKNPIPSKRGRPKGKRRKL